MYLLDLLRVITRTEPRTESTDTEAVDVSEENTEPTPVVTQNVDASQQTDDAFETQIQKAREEELMKEISDLKDQLQTAHRVSGVSRQKADKLAWDLGIFESKYHLEIAELTRKRSDEIIRKEIETMKFQDEYDNRIVDLELTNTQQMQRILELEMEQTSRRQQRDPVCDKRSGELEASVAKIESVQQHLSSIDVVTEHAKWTINYVLEQVKVEIPSAASESSQPDDEKERMIEDTQTIKCEMETVKLELEDAKERLIKDTQTIKCEMESVKVELVNAKETIAELEQCQNRLITAESQMKTITEGKDALLALKDAELKQLRKSAKQVQRKSEVKTRDVGCDTEDLPQPVKAKGIDVGCCTDDFPQLVKPKSRDVSCDTDDLPSLPEAGKKDVGCGIDDLAPLAAAKEIQGASADEGKQSVDESERLTEFREVSSRKKKAKLQAEAAAKKEERAPEKDKTPAELVSIYETVMDVISPSQFPPLSGKRPPGQPAADVRPARQPAADVRRARKPAADVRPARQPAADVQPPVVFQSADYRYKQKPIEGYTVNLSEGRTSVHPPARPQAKAAPTAASNVAPEKEKAATAKPAASFAIVSGEIPQLQSADKLVLLDIHYRNYGRIVGRGGKNVRRLEETHGVMMTLVQNQNALQFYNLKISGGSPAKRRAAAQEVIEGLPVTIECSNVDLRQLRHLKMRSSETEFFVSVRRPMSRDVKLQLSGRINDCRKAFDLLVNGRDPRPSPK
ncbi:neurofilament medium polypeptide [Daphnia magna]|uniref:neurofilament medium polypeptide n=1 Tax=Daphnia magna TaxID=35525 RepID=UPI001E1BDBFC|nr:neurofilament medium polypeptide [Daphnia magna]